MNERFFTDDEIHAQSGKAPRVPAGVPRATCLECGFEHHAYYCAQACDCRIELREKRTYGEWLRAFQKYGMGVLDSPTSAKFAFAKVITGRTALTFHLQSDLILPSHQSIFEPHYDRADFKAHGMI